MSQEDEENPQANREDRYASTESMTMEPPETEESYVNALAAQRARSRANRLSQISQVSSITPPSGPVNLADEPDMAKVSHYQSLFFIRMDSTEMEWTQKHVKLKFIANYLCGGMIGEGNFTIITKGS